RALSHAVLLFFFFFQAEDGIRDFHVTGVQTCALPISRWLRPGGRGRTAWPNPTAHASSPSRWCTGPPARTSGARRRTSGIRPRRSEERRVGKEGKCRRRREH